jgi:hypothetical protein
LKKVKNYLRSSLANEKLSILSILFIENIILEEMNWENIDKFATKKVI